MPSARRREVHPAPSFIEAYRKLFDWETDRARYQLIYNTIRMAVSQAPDDLRLLVQEAANDPPLLTLTLRDLVLTPPLMVMYRLVDEHTAELLFIERI